jgi:hypothetical protein
MAVDPQAPTLRTGGAKRRVGQRPRLPSQTAMDGTPSRGAHQQMQGPWLGDVAPTCSRANSRHQSAPMASFTPHPGPPHCLLLNVPHPMIPKCPGAHWLRTGRCRRAAAPPAPRRRRRRSAAGSAGGRPGSPPAAPPSAPRTPAPPPPCSSDSRHPGLSDSGADQAQGVAASPLKQRVVAWRPPTPMQLGSRGSWAAAQQ